MRLPILLLLSTFYIIHSTFAGITGVKPLAQNHVLVDVAPDPANYYCYNPTILALPDGRLVAGYRPGGTASPGAGMKMFTSDDHGKTWQYRAFVNNTGQARLLLANNVLYLFGSTSLRVSKSTNRGQTWSTPVALRFGESWHQSANNFIISNGYLYTAVEYARTRDVNGWEPGDLSPVLFRAKVTDDLTNYDSWRPTKEENPAQELPFKNTIPGYRENTMPTLNNSGIPFYIQTFPNSNSLSGRSFYPMGWLETNIAKITDPTHPWYDPAQKTIHLLMRANTGSSNIAAIAKVTENPDGTMTTSLVKSPTGITQLFIPLPGGQMRFHILQDPQTKLYWLLGSQTTYSMTRGEKLPRLYYGLPENQRQRLVLHFSKDLIHWDFAGVVAIGESPNSSRHYADMDIDGDDLVILSRSADAQSKSAHDNNLITFHRVPNFRTLTY